MNALQQKLVETLAARRIAASFNGRFLNGSSVVKRANGKSQKMSFGIAFDDAATLDGPRVCNVRGTYGEAFARDAFFEAILLGQGDDAALKFACECREAGVRSGASDDWAAAHESQLPQVV